MALNIGTNLNYQGEKFLDNRKNLVSRKEDLLNWNILVPEGFEVFVEGKWYMYSKNNSDPITGKFKERNNDLIEDISEINSKLEEIITSTKGFVKSVEISDITTDLLVEPVEIKLTIDPSISEYSGEDINVNISWEITKNSLPNTEIEKLELYIDNKLIEDEISNNSTGNLEKTFNKLGLTQIKLKSIDPKIIDEKIINYYQVHKIIIGTSTLTEYEDSLKTSLQLKELEKTIYNNYEINNVTSNQYLWILVPKELNEAPNTVTLNSEKNIDIEEVLNPTVEDYNIYRSTNIIDSINNIIITIK